MTDCTPTIEIPYDGADQDCDGEDLTDVDADGSIGLAAGGNDCDDADPATYPGAAEVPYDGIDQNCDGADVSDLDGDGFLAVEAGGADCADADAASYPGAVEVRGDGGDNDCDGRIDEYVTCWDGTGDFTAVQEGIDGTPDGGTLEICSGTYEETVRIEDRTIVVEGDDPLGVLITWNFEGDYSNLITIEGDSEVRIASLALESGAWCLYTHSSLWPVKVDVVGFQACRAGVWMVHPSAGISIERSIFAGMLGYAAWFDGDVVFRENIVDASGGHFWIDAGSGTRVAARNNLFIGGAIMYAGGSSEEGGAEATFENNTFVGVDQVMFGGGTANSWPRSTFSLTNNIFSDFRILGGQDYPLWYGIWEPCDLSGRDGVPTADDNLFSDRSGTMAEVWCWSEVDWLYELDDRLSAEAANAITSGSIEADPQFTSGPMGSYGLAATSPAVDAGSGDPDPDGTPPDLGAFGGPDGNWYEEVPWPLP